VHCCRLSSCGSQAHAGEGRISRIMPVTAASFCEQAVCLCKEQPALLGRLTLCHHSIASNQQSMMRHATAVTIMPAGNSYTSFSHAGRSMLWHVVPVGLIHAAAAAVRVVLQWITACGRAASCDGCAPLHGQQCAARAQQQCGGSWGSSRSESCAAAAVGDGTRVSRPMWQVSRCRIS
jgi:hypothetical protein